MNYKKENFSDFDGGQKTSQGKTVNQFSPHDSDLPVRSMIVGCATQINSNCVPIILPNTIHKCKKHLKK
jgi:hypothetical protein